MRVFILSCLVAIVVARPDIGLTLQQQQSQHVLPLNAHSAQPHVYQQLPQEHSFAGFAGQQQQLNQYPPSMLYGAPAQPQQQQQADAPLPLAPEEPTPSPVNYAEDTYQMALRHSAMPHASGYQSGPQETKVHKHIYVHVPPKDFEEEDAVQPRVHHQQAPKQKHYKIVFIKAPSAPAARAPIVAPPPQNEEKTLIYVLHKKPEMDQDIVIPTAPPTKPSKPEVYFIKYKTKKEEHPVYGPPPQQQQGELMDMEPRNQGEQTQVDFGAMNVADLLPPTTMQAMLNEQQQPQLLSAADQQQPQSLYSAPTVSAYTGEEVPPTTLAAPSQQYLPAAPEAPQAPIVVEEQQQQREEPQQPATSYIPPPAGNRYFLKRRK